MDTTSLGGQSKVKLCLCLIKYHTMKARGRVDV